LSGRVDSTVDIPSLPLLELCIHKSARKLFILSEEQSVPGEMLATDITLRTVDCVSVFKGSIWRP